MPCRSKRTVVMNWSTLTALVSRLWGRSRATIRPKTRHPALCPRSLSLRVESIGSAQSSLLCSSPHVLQTRVAPGPRTGHLLFLEILRVDDSVLAVLENLGKEQRESAQAHLLLACAQRPVDNVHALVHGCFASNGCEPRAVVPSSRATLRRCRLPALTPLVLLLLPARLAARSSSSIRFGLRESSRQTRLGSLPFSATANVEHNLAAGLSVRRWRWPGCRARRRFTLTRVRS